MNSLSYREHEGRRGERKLHSFIWQEVKPYAFGQNVLKLFVAHVFVEQMEASRLTDSF